MISVCMATYNGEDFITEQLDSIIQQLSPEDELIISDDNSTDKTQEILKKYQKLDHRIKVFHFLQSKNGVKSVNLATRNFENALLNASGDIIVLSDQDDIWLPNKLNIINKYLLIDGYDYINSDCYVINKSGDIIQNSIYPDNYIFNRWKSLIGMAPFQGCCAAFKRSVLEKALPFPPKIQSHDRWIGWIASFGFKIKAPIKDKLILYRRHEHNVSSATTKSRESMIYRISTRIRYMYELVKRIIFNMR